MEEGFRGFLRRAGRSPNATARCIRCVEQFEQYLYEHRHGRDLDGSGPDDLEAFVTWVERAPKTSAKTHLWALRYYFEYTSNDEMRSLAGALRQERIERKPFALKDFRGVDPVDIEKLAAVGVHNVKEMLEAGRTPHNRQALAESSGASADAILELVKMSDLARIPGIKGIRARLYHDGGIDTIEKLARCDPVELREALLAYIDRTGFDGIAPLPKEAKSAVAKAKRLPKVAEY